MDLGSQRRQAVRPLSRPDELFPKEFPAELQGVENQAGLSRVILLELGVGGVVLALGWTLAG